MLHERMSNEEVGQRGKEWYENHLRSLVETNENIGKMIAIDVETGEYEIDLRANSIAMTDRMLAKRPDAELLQLRIGYGAVDSFGGFRIRPIKG